MSTAEEEVFSSDCTDNMLTSNMLITTLSSTVICLSVCLSGSYTISSSDMFYFTRYSGLARQPIKYAAPREENQNRIFKDKRTKLFSKRR